MTRSLRIPTLAAILAVLAAGCTQPGEATKRNDDAPSARVASATVQAAPATPAASQEAAPVKATESRILGKKDFTLRGRPACELRFAYAGMVEETIFWEEPCAAVTARLVTRQELEKLGKWTRLDDFARKFVNALPGGKVLYVEGSFTASVYPVGTTGSTYEVAVAD